MIEPVTTFRDPQGAPLRRWAIHAGMLITDVNYDARSGCLDVVVENNALAAHGCRVGSYTFDGPEGWDHETIEVVQAGQLQRTGPITVVFNATADVWAIRKHGWCWSRKSGEWEYEPSPSSRDDEFLERCRFTLEEALPLAAEIRRIEASRRADAR